MQIFATRKSDGVEVPVQFEDRGDVIPGFREDGTRFKAWTSYVVVDGNEMFIQFDAGALPSRASGRRMQDFRYRHDMKAIRALGYKNIRFDC